MAHYELLTYKVVFENGEEGEIKAFDDIDLIRCLIQATKPFFPAGLKEIECLTEKRKIPRESIDWLERMSDRADYENRAAVMDDKTRWKGTQEPSKIIARCKNRR